LKIEGRREGIRADYVERIIDYWRAVFRRMMKGEGRIYAVITNVQSGSVDIAMELYTRKRKIYQRTDVPPAVLSQVQTPEELFRLEDPMDIITAFTDEFGVKSVEMSRNGWSVGFGIEEIERYRKLIHREYGSLIGKVLAISALNLREGVRVGLRWEVNPKRTIKVKVGGEFERVFVENYKRTVEVHGLIYYGPSGAPIRIDDVRRVVPIRKVAPPLSRLEGAWKDLPMDSVAFVRKIRREWSDDYGQTES